LRPADLQLIEIAKALYGKASVIIMDEPTAALGASEREHLVTLVKRLRDRGVGILYIAHDLDEVLAVSDRVTVMRDGMTVVTLDAAITSPSQLVEYMVGGHVALLERETTALGDNVLVLDGVGQEGLLHDIHLTCREGEILGITGLVGSGRTRLVNVIAGLERVGCGSMTLDGEAYRPMNPRSALASRVALVPENRTLDSLLMDRPSTESIMLATSITRYSFLRRGEERRQARSWMQALRVKPSDPSATPSSMSGGNQQKLSIAKALQSNARVLILDEPGQGVDIAAKDQIFRSIRGLAAEGRTIIIVSSELSELAALVDRLVVMRRGRVSGVLQASEISEHRVLELATSTSPAKGTS
jgi:ABC-type sugar transport system ATPase subunit